MAFTPIQAIQILFAGYFAWDAWKHLRTGRFKRYFVIFLRRSPLQWLKTIGLVLAELTCLLILISWLIGLKFSFLQFSWLNLIATKADGPTAGRNLVVSTAFLPGVGVLFFILLAINMPRLARREEEVYRRFTKNWRDGMIRSIKFGFVHMIVGVPVAAAIGLSLHGAFFTWRYFRGGVRESTLYHTLANYAVLSSLGVYLVLQSLTHAR